MTRLEELPCLWIAPDAVPPAHVLRMHRYLPHAFRVTPDDTEARRDFLSRETASHVLVMPAQVLPDSSLPAFQPAPLLLRSGSVLGTMSRNAINGTLVVEPGPRICPRALLMTHPAVPVVEALLPIALAEWVPNDDPETAFRAGYRFGVDLELRIGDPRHSARAALRASLGSDVPHGRWWLIGLAHGVLGQGNCDRLWSGHVGTLDGGRGTVRHLNEVARLVRLQVGLRLHPLTPEQSRCIKAITPPHPEPEVFERMAAFCDGLGPDGARMARHYREAIRWLWLQDSRKPGVSGDRREDAQN